MTFKTRIILLFLLQCTLFFGQQKPMKIEYCYPKDEATFNTQNEAITFNYEPSTFGKTTMIVHCESFWGTFDFIFKKKVLNLTRILDFQSTSVEEVYDFKTKKWKLSNNSNSYPPNNEKPKDTTVYSTHNLYALVLAHDHGGVLQKAIFQDFGNEIYWPEFDYPNCTISDEDKDGKPEFYLTYKGNSDGLDAKPIKQIIYSFKEKELAKSKATAFLPAGNAEDTFYVEYDNNWKLLPSAIKVKSKKIIDSYKN